MKWWSWSRNILVALMKTVTTTSWFHKLCLWIYITSIRNRYITTISGLRVDQDCVHLILQDPKKCKSTPEHWNGMHAIVPNQGESRAACYRQVSSFWMGWFDSYAWRSAKQEGGRSQRTHTHTETMTPPPLARQRRQWPLGAPSGRVVVGTGSTFGPQSLGRSDCCRRWKWIFTMVLLWSFNLIWYCHLVL